MAASLLRWTGTYSGAVRAKALAATDSDLNAHGEDDAGAFLELIDGDSPSDLDSEAR